MAKMKPTDIYSLCEWNECDTAKMLKSLKLDKLLAQIGIGKHAQDLFGEVPNTLIHKGDVNAPKSSLCYAQGHGIFVIDGNLDIDGAFTFYAADAYTLLIVTGDLHVKNLHQAWDTQLIVLGKTTIDGLILIETSDAGFSVFRGTVTSKDRVINEHVECGVPMFAKKPKGTERRLAKEQSTDPETLHPALVKNTVKFGIDAKTHAGAQPIVPPTPEALSKMTVQQFFEALGNSMSGCPSAYIINSKIDPRYIHEKYLQPGVQPTPFESMVIKENSVIDAFPSTLRTLTELKIYDYTDAALLNRLIRLLPQLPALQELTIASTCLKVLPSEIGQLKKIKKLVIGPSGIKVLPPEIGQLATLTELELIENQVLSTLPAELSNLKKLRKFVIIGHAVTKMPKGLESMRKQLTFCKVAGLKGWE